LSTPGENNGNTMSIYIAHSLINPNKCTVNPRHTKKLKGEKLKNLLESVTDL
jgi:hypothetical protein